MCLSVWRRDSDGVREVDRAGAVWSGAALVLSGSAALQIDCRRHTTAAAAAGLTVILLLTAASHPLHSVTVQP